MGPASVSLETLARWLTQPTAKDHKYSRGVVEFHTGSRAYPGAALLSVLGALHTGVGMVRYLGPPSVSSLVIQAHPEVVLTPGRVDAVVVGSGMATPPGPQAIHRVREALSREVPTVIDAGALDYAGPLPPSPFSHPTRRSSPGSIAGCMNRISLMSRMLPRESLEISGSRFFSKARSRRLSTTTGHGGTYQWLPRG